MAVPLLATVWFCRVQARNLILAKGVMLNDAPTDDADDEVIDAAQDRQTVLQSLWNTGKIVHREAAIRRLARLISVGQAVPAQFESWVVGAAFDPDLDVREVALGFCANTEYSGLAAICVAQLRDYDPEVRLLALSGLKQASADVGVPSVISLMEDPDPRVIATGLILLENWTGETFGVKLVDTVPNENKETGLMEFSDKSKAKAGKPSAARQNVVGAAPWGFCRSSPCNARQPVERRATGSGWGLFQFRRSTVDASA